MYHMHRVHMVHMVHVMDVVLHIDRPRSRHGNFHRNLYNMRYDRHILFLAATQAKTSSTFSFMSNFFGVCCINSICSLWPHLGMPGLHGHSTILVFPETIANATG